MQYKPLQILIYGCTQELKGADDDTSTLRLQEQSDDDFIGLWKDICETQQKTVSWMIGMQIRGASVRTVIVILQTIHSTIPPNRETETK